jgi:hypothetical protein
MSLSRNRMCFRNWLGVMRMSFEYTEEDATHNGSFRCRGTWQPRTIAKPVGEEDHAGKADRRCCRKRRTAGSRSRPIAIS